MLACLVLRPSYDSLDMPLDAVLIYQRLCKLNAGVFEVRASTSDAVHGMARVAGLAADVALHVVRVLCDVAALWSVGSWPWRIVRDHGESLVALRCCAFKNAWAFAGEAK
jgi:hypothetical protein